MKAGNPSTCRWTSESEESYALKANCLFLDREVMVNRLADWNKTQHTDVIQSKQTGRCRASTWKRRSEGSRALPRVYVKDPAGMHVDEVEDLVGHRVKARPRLDVVVVVVSDEDAGGVHGKRPETIEVDLLAHLHCGSHEHQAAAEPLGADALYRPETLHVEEVLRVEEKHASLGVEVVQHVLDSERHVSVSGVVESWEDHRRVLVVLEDFVERSPPFLQLLKSVTREKAKPKEEKT